MHIYLIITGDCLDSKATYLPNYKIGCRAKEYHEKNRCVCVFVCVCVRTCACEQPYGHKSKDHHSTKLLLYLKLASN